MKFKPSKFKPSNGGFAATSVGTGITAAGIATGGASLAIGGAVLATTGVATEVGRHVHDKRKAQRQGGGGGATSVTGSAGRSTRFGRGKSSKSQ